MVVQPFGGLPDEFSTGNNWDTPARDLAYGQQRALELGVTLSMVPELVLLDEPTAGILISQLVSDFLKVENHGEIFLIDFKD